MIAPGAIAPPWVSRINGGGASPWTAGNALRYDGDNDQVALASEITFAADFTFSCWVNLVNVSSIVMGRQASGFYALFINTTTRMNVQLANNGVFDFAEAIVLGNWFHHMTARSGTNTRVYRNGVQATTGSAFTGAGEVAFDLFGTRSVLDLYFDGDMDDCYFWDGVVGSDQDAIDLYNAGVPLDPETVIADADYKYRFNSESGIVLVDSGENENDGELENFADPDSNWISRL